ncbi:signal peptide peptidase-like 2B [Mercenaria mercenaria]|uniref:signal peptide peptidase-like 2B n=1 Tax=Mercenaria mercenaria TaxID=6596 RepID=UPI001E1E165E|nr:signal peptide peptidase-like 2B [Mercenaria mercenaria]
MESKKLSLHILILLTSFMIQVEYTVSDNGVMYSKISGEANWDKHFCISYNPLFHELPTKEDQALPYSIVDLSSKYGCNASDYNTTSVSDLEKSIVLVARGNCTFSQKALIAQTAGAVAVVVASKSLLTPGASNETTDYKNINITVATALWKNVDDIKQKDLKQVAILFAPGFESKFDPNLALIFLIAVSNIVIGGFWAGKTKHAKYQKLKYKHKRERPSTEERRGSGSDESVSSDDEEEETVDVSMIIIIVFFVLVCAFIVLLYFFYDYLVYVVIVLFCLAGAMGLYYCFIHTWHKICPIKARLPQNRVPLLKSRPHYRDLALLAVCFGISIFWGVERHAPYAWVIQDILGYAFCLNVMKSVGVPNMKVCTVMLVLLFLYDIFFVFITPLFTKSGDSIMVKVATGGGSKTQEQLPMVFKVPRLTQDAISACPLPYSLLGFGDIIIPGLLVSHNHAFDLRVNSKRLYYIATCVGYTVGLIITFCALALMETGQPALLYLVPCTLVTTYVIGCIRGEVKMLWNGLKDSDSDQGSKTENVTNVDSNNGGLESVVTSSGISNNATMRSNSGNHSPASMSSTDSENRELLRK